MPGLLVITNAKAGSAREEKVGAALDVLESEHDVSVRACGDPVELDRILAGRGHRVPVVAGGDGSLHLVVGALRRTGELSASPVGVIPLGTGNDLARTAGVPLDPAAAAHALLDALRGGGAHPRELLVDDDGGIVINAVHVGMGAQAARTAERWKPRLGITAYPLGAVMVGLRSPGWRLRVEADGEVLGDVDRRVLMVGLALGRSIGGGSPLAPDARPDDGLVDVVVSEATGPLARVGYAVRLRSGEHVERPDVRHVQARHVAVSGQAFPYNADGEVGGPVRRREWTVVPRAWRLLAPRAGRAS